MNHNGFQMNPMDQQTQPAFEGNSSQFNNNRHTNGIEQYEEIKKIVED